MFPQNKEGTLFLLIIEKQFSFVQYFVIGNSPKWVWEWSILAVRIATFRPLREPIRMLLFTMDQYCVAMTCCCNKICLVCNRTVKSTFGIFLTSSLDNNNFTSKLFSSWIDLLTVFFCLIRSLCFLFSNLEYSSARYSVTENMISGKEG